MPHGVEFQHSHGLFRIIYTTTIYDVTIKSFIIKGKFQPNRRMRNRGQADVRVYSPYFLFLFLQIEIDNTHRTMPSAEILPAT